MPEDQTMDWVPFYEELASRLLGFRDDRTALVARLERAFTASGLRLPKLEASGVALDDIDPFTFLGTFNRGMTDANRLAVARALRGELAVGAPAPTSLEGIPTLNNLNATFYRFKGDPARGAGDVDALWEAFGRALALADSPSPEAEAAFCAAFDAARPLKGNGWKLTMGLYWARPDAFLSLDGKDRWFLTDEAHSSLPASLVSRLSAELAHGVPEGRAYLAVCREVAGALASEGGGATSFPELSRMAWAVAAEVNEAKRRDAARQEMEVDAVLEDAGDHDAPEAPSEATREAPSPATASEPYTKDDFLSEVYLSEDGFDTLSYLVRRKKCVILEGAPGTGKTFCSVRLAYALMGERARDRVEMVQFHQSYSYEDFVEGFRPTADGFELRKGAFYRFCKRAAADPGHGYFFVIDEINRANLSKVFGELFMLVEADKRGVGLQLLYSGETFSVPRNVYLLGTMNTADRSLAMMDFALRRRFAFFDLEPGFGTEQFSAYVDDLGSPALARLVARVQQLNEEISADENLGPGYVVGHSFLCGLKVTDAPALARVVDFEIVPLLREYWFDDRPRADEWAARLKAALA